jgi:hypothetical protein
VPAEAEGQDYSAEQRAPAESRFDEGPDPSAPAAPGFVPNFTPDPRPRDADYGSEVQGSVLTEEQPLRSAPVTVDAGPAEPIAQSPETGASEEPWTPALYDRDDDFSPFQPYDPTEEKQRSGWLRWPLLLLLLVAAAAAFWFFGPAEWKERLGVGSAGETPLQLMMTHSDRQQLESGNELLTVSGRVINPTSEDQKVPPIQAQLRSRTGKLVYSWTIAPPAPTLAPRASATFNSANTDVPAGGDELTISLGPPRS